MRFLAAVNCNLLWLLGTPTHISRVPDSIDALGALNQAYKKDGTSAVHDPQMRRTVKDLVASIDPTVKIDKDVEDVSIALKTTLSL